MTTTATNRYPTAGDFTKSPDRLAEEAAGLAREFREIYPGKVPPNPRRYLTRLAKLEEDLQQVGYEIATDLDNGRGEESDPEPPCPPDPPVDSEPPWR
jgi:hypothetical protein